MGSVSSAEDVNKQAGNPRRLEIDKIANNQTQAAPIQIEFVDLKSLSDMYLYQRPARSDLHHVWFPF